MPCYVVTERSLCKSTIELASPARRILHELRGRKTAICNLGELLPFPIKCRGIGDVRLIYSAHYPGDMTRRFFLLWPLRKSISTREPAMDAWKNVRGSVPARVQAGNSTHPRGLLFPQAAHRIALRPNASCQRRPVVGAPRRSGPPGPEPGSPDQSGRPTW